MGFSAIGERLLMIKLKGNIYATLKQKTDLKH